MIATLLVVLACVALVGAQVMPAHLYERASRWLAVAEDADDCAFYAFNQQRLVSGVGYLYFNPYICTGRTPPNLVGCNGNLNYTTYRDYYLASNNALVAGTTNSYYLSLRTPWYSNPPSNFDKMYSVKNCMFCKLLDSSPYNFDPFCPPDICERYQLDPSRCLSGTPNPDTVGIGIKNIAPNLDETWDVDTEYDILFSVYGVSNTSPYVGMPLNTMGEGCPNGMSTRGLDGIPTGFTFQPDYQWLKSNLNLIDIKLQDGTIVHPGCSMIAPNGGPTERVVVFCGTNLGSETNLPVSMTINGPVRMSNGEFTTTSTMSVKIGTLNQGSLMVSAESYVQGHPLFSSFFTFHANYHKDPCPIATTRQVIMTSWTKGLRQVHPSLLAFPAGLRWTNQNMGITVGLANGVILKGRQIEIHDDDDDGFIHVCLRTLVKAVNITISQGLFYDPRNTMNVYQFAKVTDPISMYEPYPVVNPSAVATPPPPTPAPTVAPTNGAR